MLAFEVTKPSKENGAGESKENIVSFSHLDLAERRTLFQWSLDLHNNLEILGPLYSVQKSGIRMKHLETDYQDLGMG